MDARVAILALLFVSPYHGHSQAATTAIIPKGIFHGKLVLIPDPNGRDMILQQPFSYTDWESHTLEAPAGFRSDGATIPRAAWSIIGGPWDGKYRAAAVVHDVGCDTHQYSWRITDRLFYEAMIDSDVPKAQALTMYYAVLVGGPHWDLIAAPVADTRDALDRKMNEIEAAAETAKKKKVDEAAREQAPEDVLASMKSSSIVTSEEEKPKRAAKAGEYHKTAAPREYQGYIFSQQPTKNVSEEALKKFLAEAKQQEAAGHPLTPEDAEKRAKVDAVSSTTF